MEVTKTQKKQTKRVIAFVLVAALLIGGAFAFLTAQDSKSNVFTIGNIKAGLFEEVDLDYSQDIDDGEFYGPEDESPPSFKNVMPDSSMIKRPWIQNTGKNNEYVFMKVGIPAVKTAVLNDDGTSTGEYVETEFVQLINENGEIGVNDGWHLIPFKDTQDYQSKVDENGNIMHYYTYYYERELEARPDADQDGQDKTVPLFEKVKYLDVSNLATFDVTVANIDFANNTAGYQGYLISAQEPDSTKKSYRSYKISDMAPMSVEDLENTVVYLKDLHIVGSTTEKVNTYIDGTASQKPGDMISDTSILKQIIGDNGDILVIKKNSSFYTYIDEGSTSEIAGYILNLRNADSDLEKMVMYNNGGFSGIVTSVEPGVYYLMDDVFTTATVEFRQNTDTADHSTFYVPINAYAVQTEGVDFSDPTSVYTDFFTDSYKLIAKEEMELEGRTFYKLQEISNVGSIFVTDDGENYTKLIENLDDVKHCEDVDRDSYVYINYPGIERDLDDAFGEDNWDYYLEDRILVVRNSKTILPSGVEHSGTYNAGDRIMSLAGTFFNKKTDGTIIFDESTVPVGGSAHIDGDAYSPYDELNALFETYLIDGDIYLPYDELNALFEMYFADDDTVSPNNKTIITEDNTDIYYYDYFSLAFGYNKNSGTIQVLGMATWHPGETIEVSTQSMSYDQVAEIFVPLTTGRTVEPGVYALNSGNEYYIKGGK